jgi:hypothetical protein
MMLFISILCTKVITIISSQIKFESFEIACIEDLPDELLILIWNKLNNLDVFYSFIGVNKSCFTIACKLESRRVPDTNSLLSLFDARHHVTPVLLNHGEKHLLTQLDFELG